MVAPPPHQHRFVQMPGSKDYVCTEEEKMKWKLASSQVVTHCYFFQVVVSEDKSRRMGSACHLTAKCSHCSGVLGQTMTSQKMGLAHTGHDINRRIISAAAVTGIGFT